MAIIEAGEWIGSPSEAATNAFYKEAEAAMNAIADDLDAQAGKANIRTADILQRIAKQLREDK